MVIAVSATLFYLREQRRNADKLRESVLNSLARIEAHLGTRVAPAVDPQVEIPETELTQPFASRASAGGN